MVLVLGVVFLILINQVSADCGSATTCTETITPGLGSLSNGVQITHGSNTCTIIHGKGYSCTLEVDPTMPEFAGIMHHSLQCTHVEGLHGYDPQGEWTGSILNTYDLVDYYETTCEQGNNDCPDFGCFIDKGVKIEYDILTANMKMTSTGRCHCVDKHLPSWTIASCSPCIAETCESLGYECGNWSDGCGETLNCGSCEVWQDCILGQCQPETCPDTCESLGYECDPQEVCGEQEDCGSCDEGYYCYNGICKEGGTCKPLTCEVNYDGQCGYFNDGCYNMINCECDWESEQCISGFCVCKDECFGTTTGCNGTTLITNNCYDSDGDGCTESNLVYTDCSPGTCGILQPLPAIYGCMCFDGTPFDECSSSDIIGKPYFCDSGVLVEDCNQCGCPDGYECMRSGICSGSTPNPCGDGTCDVVNGECDNCVEDCDINDCCGDGFCQSVYGEDCDSCPEDCGCDDGEECEYIEDVGYECFRNTNLFNCSDVSTCGNYNNQSNCEDNFCSLDFESNWDDEDCESCFEDTCYCFYGWDNVGGAGCDLVTEFCKWDETSDICIADSEYENYCTNESGTCVGSSEIITDCDEEPLGWREINLTYSWQGTGEGTCSGDNVISKKCLSSVELGFFNFVSLLISIVLIFAFYLYLKEEDL